jgi:hypothetical protein
VISWRTNHHAIGFLLYLLFAQSQVSHKGHIEVALNHPGVRVSEMEAQAKEDTWAERCCFGLLVAARRGIVDLRPGCWHISINFSH